MAAAKSLQVLTRPSYMTVWDRSGSYIFRIDACMKTSVPPRLPGCSGLPSILVGRPIWLSTSSPVAAPACGMERGIEQRLARDDLLRRVHVRNDFLGRQLGAGAQARHRRRRSHQLQHVAAIDPLRISLRIRRKLVLEEIAIFLGIRQFLEALPQALAAVACELRPRRNQIDRILRVQTLDSSSRFHRWHVEQIP